MPHRKFQKPPYETETCKACYGESTMLIKVASIKALVAGVSLTVAVLGAVYHLVERGKIFQ